MFIRTFYIIFFCFFTLAISCFADNEKSEEKNYSNIKLEEALSKAYNNSDELQQGRVNFLNSLEAFPKALSGFLPRISAGVQSSNTSQKGVSQYSNDKSTSQNTQRTLQIQQSVFDGWASTANLKSAQSSVRAARAKFYSDEQNTLLKIIQTYLKYYSSKEKYEISEIAVKSYQKQVEFAEEKLKLGEATHTDVATSMSYLASAETSRLSYYAGYQTAEADFFKVFGFHPSGDIIKSSPPTDLPESLEELQNKAKSKNFDLVYLTNQLSVTKSQESISKSALLPNVSLAFSVARNYYNKESPTSGRVNGFNANSTISVEIPIFNQGAEHSRIRESKNRTRIATLELDNIRKQLNSQCISIWNGFSASKSKVNASSKAINAAQLAYEGMMQEQSVGNKTIVDVLDSKSKLYQAKLNNVDIMEENVLLGYQMKSLIGELTAKKLKLNTQYFDPDKEIRQSKIRIIGTKSERTRKYKTNE
jgi:outer membrane protein